MSKSKQAKPKLPSDDFSGLNTKEEFLLRRANNLLRDGDLQGALMYFRTGREANPDSQAFEFGVFMVEEKLKKAKEKMAKHWTNIEGRVTVDGLKACLHQNLKEYQYIEHLLLQNPNCVN